VRVEQRNHLAVSSRVRCSGSAGAVVWVGGDRGIRGDEGDEAGTGVERGAGSKPGAKTVVSRSSIFEDIFSPVHGTAWRGMTGNVS
jgi:hypothetical protein